MRKFLALITIVAVFIFIVMKLFPSFGDLFPHAARVVFHPGASIRQTDNGITNVLLLGIGGGSHDGPNLTDTIMLAAIDWKKNTVTLISVPRDLWIPSLNTNSLKKLNEAYVIGGMNQAERSVSEVTGQQIHYGIRLDFRGFVDGIDQIGGVDIKVARTLDDYNYPISGKEEDACGHSPAEIQALTATMSAETDTFDFFSCRFKHLHFDPGLQHMDGTTALEFVRSRHGIGLEGSDFARSARQQLLIEAVRSKMISAAFFNPGKVLGLYGIMKNSIDTDMSDTDLGLFLDKLPFLRSAKVVSVTIDLGDYAAGRAGLLVNAPIAPDYFFSAALLPRVGDGDFSEIQKYVACMVTKGECIVDITPSPTK